MHVEGNRSSGTSRNYRANAALPPRSVLIHLHALLPPPHYGARSPRPSLSFGNECASPVAAAAGYEIMVKFDRLAAVVRAGQTATPTGQRKVRMDGMRQKWRRGTFFHVSIPADPADADGPCPTSGSGARVSARAKAARPLAGWGTYLVTEISLPHLQLSARDF